jgi:two-component system chemotaxis response regulator CheB
MGEKTKKVLLVDDDPDMVKAMAEWLTVDRDLYEVLTAANGREALEVLAHEEICLVVSDIHMPEISGLHLLSEIRIRYPQTEVILLTGYPTPEILKEVQQSGCIGFLEKPFNTADLRRLIQDHVCRKEEGFAGTLKNIQLIDLIQMCCLANSSLAIRVKKNEQIGTIFIAEGEIVHADCGHETGEEAFYQILSWQSGMFETLTFNAIPDETIRKNWQFLLMESARQVDEQTYVEEEEELSFDDLELGEEDERPFRVLIVDDSSMMCRIIKDLLTVDDGIDIVGTAQNGEEALAQIDALKPDLITLDVNMPVMDGSTALKHIMIKNPCPVVIISSIGNRSQSNVIDFLRLGAVDFINKPVKSSDLAEQQERLITAIRTAAKAQIHNFQRAKPPKLIPSAESALPSGAPPTHFAIINSGVGGYAELIKLVSTLPADMDLCILALQAMPEGFVEPLARYLDQRSGVDVRPFAASTPLQKGGCYLSTHNDPYELMAHNGQICLAPADASIPDDLSGAAFSLLLNSAQQVPMASLPLVVLLSGADVESLETLTQHKDTGGRIISQRISACMLPQPLERAIGAELVDLQLDPIEMASRLSAMVRED